MLNKKELLQKLKADIEDTALFEGLCERMTRRERVYATVRSLTAFQSAAIPVNSVEQEVQGHMWITLTNRTQPVHFALLK